MNHLKVFLSVSILFVLFSCGKKIVIPSTGVQEMSGILEYQSASDFENKIIKIHYFIPQGILEDAKIQLVLHGAGRNADEYLLGWKEKAKQYGLILLVPEFSKEQFSIGLYTQANLLDTLKQLNAPEKTLFYLLDQLFLFSKNQLKLNQSKYNIFGHSAGGQFVHRFLEFYDSPYVQQSVAANPGWYTYPDENVGFPYGIEGLPINPEALKNKFFSKDLLILLGTADTLRTNNLRVNADADLQGYHRLERGINYFERNKTVASKNKMTFNWKVDFVPDAGHEHALMSSAAADWLYGKK